MAVNQGKGSQGIKVGNNMIIMFYKGDLLLKLTPERVKELVQKGQGESFDPGTGKPMKDRVLIPYNKARSWMKLCEEAIKIELT